MAGRAWIKLYERWLHGPRHAGLPGDVLGFGAMLLLEAEALGEDGPDGVRWILGPSGASVGLESVHRRARVRQRSGQRWAKKLLDVGTLVLREDGCLGFANYRQWQENPSTERVRKHREKRYNGVTRNREAEAEAEAEAEVTPLPPVNGGGAWGEVAKVCDKLPWLGGELPKLLSPRDRIHRLVAQGATADEIVAVLESFASAVKAGKEPRDRWNAQYVFSGHYDRLRVAYGPGASRVGELPSERLARFKAEGRA